MAQYAAALATAEERFGVSRYVIAAIWGVEVGFRPLDGQAAAGAIAEHARLPGRDARTIFAAS